MRFWPSRAVKIQEGPRIKNLPDTAVAHCARTRTVRSTKYDFISKRGGGEERTTGPPSGARLYSLCNGCLAGRIIVVSKESPCWRQIPFPGRLGHTWNLNAASARHNLWNSRKPRWKIKQSRRWHYEGSTWKRRTGQSGRTSGETGRRIGETKGLG